VNYPYRAEFSIPSRWRLWFNGQHFHGRAFSLVQNGNECYASKMVLLQLADWRLPGSNRKVIDELD
jgi:hypothetical protein